MTLIACPPASFADTQLAGFDHRFQTVHGTRLHYVTGGNASGETVVLLAGYPQSGHAWRKVMPLLAARYRVIVPDLPGQGDSDRPLDGYDTQSLAASLRALLDALGVRRHHLAAHDVGAWVAFTYAASFGGTVQRLALLDAGIPGVTLPEALPVAPERAWRTWHFAFHAIADLPELLIEGKERAYLDWFLRRKTANPQTFSEADIDEYLRVFLRDGGLRAGLAYYRAAALSARQNRELVAQGKLRMPVLALSADQGSIPSMAEPLRAFADDVRGATLAQCGHFLPEEQPEAVAAQLIDFFGEHGANHT
ncbi:alpha/beta fold hydrolase [Paraburkholderia acidisoli]|uniref:Alpha/beta fold hydrolase n=1 Tax=Paraburkholderia acidisoli TaxID=2571748 RepID=A0A7Z2GPL6_9BURK|nr:alpha/beta fold hydrolase [Paraburkholderia acidisoli]QGZ65254.1 alpha/beta fold hydrolase [Paraburkholderia acidisoli]